MSPREIRRGLAGPGADSLKGDRNGGRQVFQPKNQGLMGKERTDSSPSRGPVAIFLADTGVGSLVCTEAPGPRGRLSSSPLVDWNVACQLALPPPLVLLQGWVLLINVKIGDLKKGLGKPGDLRVVLVLTWGKEGMDGSTLMKRGDLCIS